MRLTFIDFSDEIFREDFLTRNFYKRKQNTEVLSRDFYLVEVDITESQLRVLKLLLSDLK